jgi:hypothetical protein
MPNPHASPLASEPASESRTGWTRPAIEVIPLDCEITSYAPDGEPLPF